MSKWNANEDLILGDNLLLYIVSGGTTPTAANAEVLAYATSCSLQIDSETIDTSSKFSCRWNSVKSGRASYTISADALYSKNGLSFDGLVGYMTDSEGKNITWVIGQEDTSGDCNDREHTLDVSKGYYWGNGAVTSVSLEGGNNEIASCSITITGAGAISKVDAA